MSIGAYCQRCQSAFCNHCLQINEHNSRMESDRRMAGMSIGMSHQEMISMVQNSPTMTTTMEMPKKDKKLLLLRSPSK